jgi:hypothetical protein
MTRPARRTGLLENHTLVLSTPVRRRLPRSGVRALGTFSVALAAWMMYRKEVPGAALSAEGAGAGAKSVAPGMRAQASGARSRGRGTGARPGCPGASPHRGSTAAGPER